MAKAQTTRVENKNYILSKLDLFRAKDFQFALQKLVMFAVVFAASLYLFWNFDFFDNSFLAKIEQDWPYLAWKFFLLFTFYMVAHPLVRNIAESYNKVYHSWLSVILLLAYAVCLTIFSGNVKFNSVTSIKLIYFVWLIPAVALPASVKFVGVFLTRKLSPIHSRKLSFDFFTMIAFAMMTVAGVMLFYQRVVLGRDFNLHHWRISLCLSLSIIGALFSGLFSIVGWWKYRKIRFSDQTVSIPLLVILPMFATLLIWVFKGTMDNVNLNLTPELWFLVSCAVTLLALSAFVLFFAKEVKSAKVMNTIFATVLVLVWMGAFIYINYFGIVDNSYEIVDFAAATSFVIFVMMALFDKTTKSSMFQETFFTWMIVLMGVLIIFFTIVGKAKLFDLLMTFAPVDLKSLLPVLLIMLPGLYFTISVGKIMWAQSRITHGVRIEKAIKQRKVEELLAELKIGDKNE